MPVQPEHAQVRAHVVQTLCDTFLSVACALATCRFVRFSSPDGDSGRINAWLELNFIGVRRFGCCGQSAPARGRSGGLQLCAMCVCRGVLQHPSDPTSPPSGGERPGTFDGIFGGTGSGAGGHVAEGQVGKGRRRGRAGELARTLYHGTPRVAFWPLFGRCELVSARGAVIFGAIRSFVFSCACYGALFYV